MMWIMSHSHDNANRKNDYECDDENPKYVNHPLRNAHVELLQGHVHEGHDGGDGYDGDSDVANAPG